MMPVVDVGDTVMGMDLYQGGHLTHGSEFNFSGKRYHVVSYGVSESTGKLDYDEIRDLARRNRPKMIIAGFTSYHLGARLGGVSPTSRTRSAPCCWPTSATRPGMVHRRRLPEPGWLRRRDHLHDAQDALRPAWRRDHDHRRGNGPPHRHGRVPRRAGRPAHAEICRHGRGVQDRLRPSRSSGLQWQIKENAAALADGLIERGLKLAYGGTDTHLLHARPEQRRRPTPASRCAASRPCASSTWRASWRTRIPSPATS